MPKIAAPFVRCHEFSGFEEDFLQGVAARVSANNLPRFDEKSNDFVYIEEGEEVARIRLCPEGHLAGPEFLERIYPEGNDGYYEFDRAYYYRRFELISYSTDGPGAEIAYLFGEVASALEGMRLLHLADGLVTPLDENLHDTHLHYIPGVLLGRLHTAVYGGVQPDYIARRDAALASDVHYNFVGLRTIGNK